MYFLKGFTACPPKSHWDYVTSPHIVPFTASVTAAMLFFCLGASHVRSLLMMLVGGAVSALMFLLFPIPILGPVGGKHHVGMKHIFGRESDMMPPLVVFYPTEEVPHKKGVSYIPFGDIRFLSGIASHARIPLFLLKDFLFVRLRVAQNATPVPLFDKSGSPLPVIIFSHGLYGYHTLYSCLLSDLAARGAVVLSIGHLDGSAAFMREENGGKEVTLKRVNWESSFCEKAHVRRVVEMRQTLKRVFETEFWTILGFNEFDAGKYLSCSPHVHLCGHSFGGATALDAAVQEKFESDLKGGRVQSVAVFDPWHLPLQRRNLLKCIEESSTPYTTPTLMIHSGSWLCNKPSWDFFSKLQDSFLAQPALSVLSETDKNVLFVTVKTRGTNHYSVSDVVQLSPIFHAEPRAMVPSRAQIVDWCNIVLRFCNNKTRFVSKATIPIL